VRTDHGFAAFRSVQFTVAMLDGIALGEGLERVDEGKIDGRRRQRRASMKRSKVSGVFALRAQLVQVQPLPRLCSPLQQQHT